jgi:copper homeostasis protein
MSRINLEICVDNMRSAMAAKDGGADRLEVCGPLSVGGTTPSCGLILRCLELEGRKGEMTIMAMIRPHDGGFCYDSVDIDTMLRDIQYAAGIGVHGFVFGALTADRQIDVETCRRLVDEVRQMSTIERPIKTTFHRAFDVVIDPLRALDELIDLKFDRLLTSGLAPSAIQGAEMIRQLVDRAGDSIAIMAASGINAENVVEILEATGVKEVHASAAKADASRDYPIDFGGEARTTIASRVRAMRNAIDGC